MKSRTNYLLNFAALATGRQPRRPLLFSYYVTGRCPLDCRYCHAGESNPFRNAAIAELNTSDAMRLIGIMARACDTLDVTGGEPMLRPDLEALLEHARNCGMRTVLNTKGVGLANRPDLLRASMLVLSVDSLRPPCLGELFGCDAELAREVLAALQFVLDHRAEYGTQVVLSSVATPSNLADIAEVLDFAAMHKLGFHLAPQIEGIRAHAELRANEEYSKLIDLVISRKKAGHAVLGSLEYLEGIRGFRAFECHPLLMPVVRPDGRLVYPCLERAAANVSILDAGSYAEALRAATRMQGRLERCGECCHAFSRMSLTHLQRNPLRAMRK